MTILSAGAVTNLSAKLTQQDCMLCYFTASTYKGKCLQHVPPLDLGFIVVLWQVETKLFVIKKGWTAAMISNLFWKEKAFFLHKKGDHKRFRCFQWATNKELICLQGKWHLCVRDRRDNYPEFKAIQECRNPLPRHLSPLSSVLQRPHCYFSFPQLQITKAFCST